MFCNKYYFFGDLGFSFPTCKAIFIICCILQLVASKFPLVVKIGHAHAGSGRLEIILFNSDANETSCAETKTTT